MKKFPMVVAVSKGTYNELITYNEQDEIKLLFGYILPKTVDGKNEVSIQNCFPIYTSVPRETSITNDFCILLSIVFKQ